MDAQTPPLLVASYRDPLRGISVARFADNFEHDITALRAALLAVTIEKPIRFKFRNIGHVVMPYDPQFVAQTGASVIVGADPEEMIHLGSPRDPAGEQLLIAAKPTVDREDDEAFEVEITTPFTASVVMRAPNIEAVPLLFYKVFPHLEQDILLSEEENGFRRPVGRIDPDDVHIVGVHTRPDLDVGSLPVFPD